VGRTLAGAWAFSSTTRPTSSGTGTPASNSLITLADSNALAFGTFNTFPVLMASMTSFSGNGGTTGVTNKRGALEYYANTTASSYAGFYSSSDWIGFTSVTYSSRFEILFCGGALGMSLNYANNEKFLQFGRPVATTTAAQISNKGFGVRSNFAGDIVAYCHNGTTLTEGVAGVVASPQRWFALEFVPAVGVYFYQISVTGVRTLISSVTTGIPTGSFVGTQVEFFIRNNGTPSANLDIHNMSNLVIRAL